MLTTVENQITFAGNFIAPGSVHGEPQSVSCNPASMFLLCSMHRDGCRVKLPEPISSMLGRGLAVENRPTAANRQAVSDFVPQLATDVLGV